MSADNRAKDYSKASGSFIILRLIMGWVLKGLFRIEVSGLENLPTKGGYIIAANHLSWVDAFIILAYARATPRIYFIAEKHQMERNAFRKFFSEQIGGIIPVDRNSTSAYREILVSVDAVLKSGGVLGIFPEGTVSETETGELLPLKKGLGNFAAKSGAVIVPVAFHGTKELWLGKHITMTVGEPVSGKVGGRDVANEQSELTAKSLKKLLCARQQGNSSSRKILRVFLTELFS